MLVHAKKLITKSYESKILRKIFDLHSSYSNQELCNYTPQKKNTFLLIIMGSIMTFFFKKI